MANRLHKGGIGKYGFVYTATTKGEGNIEMDCATHAQFMQKKVKKSP